MNPHKTPEDDEHDGLTSGICFLLMISIIVAVSLGRCDAHGAERISRERLIYGIWLVECSGLSDHEVKDGDGGRAIGPLQIHFAYWQDAIEHRPEIGGTYQDCRRLEYAIKIVRAYLDRHARNASPAEMAACHNRGPNRRRWRDKHGRAYWAKVKRALASGAK